MKSRSLTDYLVAAKERTGLMSDRRLGVALGGSIEMVSQWRTQGKFPSEARMVRLADMAGVPRDQALLDLAEWKSDETTRDTWRMIRAKIAGAAAAVLLLVSAQPVTSPAPGLYIMENLKRRFRGTRLALLAR